MSGIGDNGIPGEILRSFVSRIERLEGEIDALNEDKKEVYAEARSTGFDTGILRIVMKRMRMDRTEIDEHEQLIELYEAALAGQVADVGTETATHVQAREGSGS